MRGRPSAKDQTPSSVHAAVPPVLYSVVAPAMKPSCNLSPTLSHLANQALYEKPFFRTDGFVVEGRLEILVVSFAALFGRARADELCDSDPVEGPLGVDELDKISVLSL